MEDSACWTTNRGPRVRATVVKSALEAFADFEPATRDQLLARFDAQQRDAIADAPRASWMSSEALIKIDAVLHAELGDEGVVMFWRQFTRRATRTPLLRPIAEGVMRLLGGPQSAFRLIPKAWDMVSRDFGRIECRVEPGRRVLVVEMHEVRELSRPELFGLGQQGSYHGVLDLVGANGTVSLDEYRPDLGRYRYRVSWE